MKLAVIGKIKTIEPIQNADRIVRADVDCGDAGTWSGVVQKDMAVDDKVTVFLQDALLPPNERWAFMESHKWRVRMARFKGVPSECVIVKGAPDMPIGTDLTEVLGVTKYEKPIPLAMTGEALGAFPTFIPKTDEPNFQTVDFQELMRQPFYVTQKADGTSCTAWVDASGLHVASRNLELREFNQVGNSNAYWKVARKYCLQDMPVGTALQFEVVGPGIQGNPMGLKELEGRYFNLFIDGKKIYPERPPFTITMPMVAQCVYHPKPYIADELRELADITYPNGKTGEGVVVRAIDQSWSFKVINLKYKD